MSQQFSWLSQLIYSNSFLLAFSLSSDSSFIPLPIQVHIYTPHANAYSHVHIMCHANKYKLCAQLQHPVTQLFYKLPFPSFLLLASIIKKQNKKNNNKKTASLFATYSTTILVAAELSQLQGAQILFVAFSSFVYLLFVPTIPTEMGKAVFLLGFFFSFLNDFDSFCKTQEVGAFLT